MITGLYPLKLLIFICVFDWILGNANSQYLSFASARVLNFSNLPPFGSRRHASLPSPPASCSQSLSAGQCALELGHPEAPNIRGYLNLQKYFFKRYHLVGLNVNWIIPWFDTVRFFTLVTGWWSFLFLFEVENCSYIVGDFANNDGLGNNFYIFLLFSFTTN